MKSRIRIDYDRSQELKPVIKIICPTNAGLSNWETETGTIDDDDPKDKLVRDFLWTPRNTVENYLFEVNQRFEINDGKSLLTTIAAIPEEQIFSRLETAITGRIIGDDPFPYSVFYEYRESGQKNNRPCPTNYERWLKITEFFEWLHKQPYSGEVHTEHSV